MSAAFWESDDDLPAKPVAESEAQTSGSFPGDGKAGALPPAKSSDASDPSGPIVPKSKVASDLDKAHAELEAWASQRNDEIPLEAYADEFQRERSAVWLPSLPKAATVPLAVDLWPEPVNVWDSGDASRLSVVTPEMLPPAIAPYIFDQADRGGVDVNQVAVNCYTACAAMIRAGIGVQMQEDMHDGGRVWTEYPVLWAAVVGMFSEKKGLGLDLATDYLKSVDTRQRMKEQAEWDRYNEEEKQHEADMKSYRTALKKNPSADKPELRDKPPRSRLWSDDATLQALAKLFSENPRGKVSIIKDELSGWFGSFDAFNAGKTDIDRPAFLSFYESKQRLIDRVGTGFYSIDRWGGCIIGGIQPDILAKVAAKLGGDGMLQRFQIVTSRPARQVPRRAADMKATALWQKVQEGLFHMEQRGNPITLSRQAAEYMDDRTQWINKALNAGLTPALAGAVGKWEGLFGRLMITSHCIAAAARGSTVPYPEVDLSTAQQAWNWMHGLLWPHAVHFYTRTIEKDSENTHLLAFANYLMARPETNEVKPGYLSGQWSHYKRHMKTTQERREFWNSAVNAGFVLPGADFDRSLQIAKTYTVNPKLRDGRFKDYGELASQQRDKYREIMPEGFTR